MAGAGRERWTSRLARVYGLRGLQRHDAQAWTLAVGSAWSAIGTGAVLPFLVLYLTPPVGRIPLATIGLGVFLQQAVRAVASPAFGAMSDRFGRKPLMVLGLLLQAATIPAFLLVHDTPMFLVVSALAGLGQAPYHPALNALLAESTPEASRVSVFGLVHMMKNLGWLIGILVAARFISHSFTLLLVTGGLFPLAFALVVALAVREPTRAPRSARKGSARSGPFAPLAGVVKSPRFLAFLACATVVFVSWGQLNTVLPKFVTAGMGLSPEWATIALAVNAALVLALQVPVSARAERWVRAHGLALATAVSGLAYVMLAAIAALVVTHPRLAEGGLLAATVVLTLAEMLDTPLLFALATDLAPPGVVGGAMGVLALAAPVGMGAAPLLAGLIGDRWGWTAAWLALALACAAGAMGFLAFARRERVTKGDRPVNARSQTDN